MIRTIYDIRHLVIILGCAALLVTHAQNPLLQTRRPPGGDPLKPLCEPDAQIPDDLIQCGSCTNRCGTKTNPDNLRFGGSALCSCDELCGYHDDCCQDFQELCPMEFENMQRRIAQYPSTFHHTDFECMYFDGEFGGKENVVIHTCPDGSKCEFIGQLNEDVNTFVPMYDVHRGVHYISGQCALCNGAREVEPWRVTLECGAMDEHKDYVDTGIINSTESLTDIKNSGNCFLSYSIFGEQRPCFNPVVSSCKEGCQNQNLVSLCESGYQSLTILKVTAGKIFGREIVYRNAYCAACNAADGATTDNLMCSGDFHRQPGIQRPPPVVSFSLTLVFDFDPRNGLVVGKVPPPECAAEEVYVPHENVCRAIRCSSGFILDGSNCIPEPWNITAIVSGTFSSEPTSKIIDKLNQETFDLETKLTDRIVGILYTLNITSQNLIVAVTMGFYNRAFTITNRIHCNCDFSPLDNKGNNQPLAARFDNSVTRGVRAVTTNYFLSRDIKIDFDLLNVSVVRSQHMGCTWLVYQLNETQTGNGTVAIIATGKTYASGRFQIVDERTVIVCETDLSIPDGEINDLDVALSVVTFICIGISIICLVIRTTLQFCVSSFRNRPGRLQLQLTIAFLIAFVMLIVGVFLSDFPEACTIAAILLAYGFLAAFIWMNVIAVNTWLAFRPSAAFSRADDEGRSLVIHYLLGWGIPLLLVVGSIVINYTNGGGQFSPEFGGSRCWYTQRYAMLLYFGLPIALSIIINITLYIWTSINLHKAFKSRADMIKRKRYNFFVYVRLFILMGITWIFGFISAFTDEIVIDFIFVILTSLQGLFLFISFVCNKRVFFEVKQKMKSETSTSGKQTKSTTLPNLNSESASESKI